MGRDPHEARALMRVAAVLAVALLAACGPEATKTETGMAKPGNMQPYPKREFTKGALIRPAEGLVAWLDERKKADAKTVVRVPVTTSFDRISIKETKIGDLAVRVQDSALGVSFLERANQFGKDGGGRCVLSLIGYWRGEGVFDVIQVEGLAPEGAAHAEVQVSVTP